MMTWIRGVFSVILVVLFTGLTRCDSARVSDLGSCPTVSITDAILGFHDSICHLHHSYNIAVIEGDEGSLQKALHMVYSHTEDYVAVLFYASWCPFSRNFRPSFSVLSTLYPSIPHFAIAESAVKLSVLSKYGVHGFPTLLLLNSTMRVHYRGYRSLSSLVSFYSDITGMFFSVLLNRLSTKLESAHCSCAEPYKSMFKVFLEHGPKILRAPKQKKAFISSYLLKATDNDYIVDLVA
ncbi:hypothetical protein RND81_01G173600 [Saponaria officinalis]|uniref:Thioredoxin domain-containing protein n=1 Tax=Saponaria officinalis TaxID=3572 RepID=A0AAW1NFP9_SAPOF